MVKKIATGKKTTKSRKGVAPNEGDFGSVSPLPLVSSGYSSRETLTLKDAVKSSTSGSNQENMKSAVKTRSKDDLNLNGTSDVTSDTMCVICSKQFHSRGCHYAKATISIAGLKRRFCEYFIIPTADKDPRYEEFLRVERFPFCPACFILVNELYRREEQLRASLTNFMKAKMDIMQSTINGLKGSEADKYYQVKLGVAQQKTENGTESDSLALMEVGGGSIDVATVADNENDELKPLGPRIRTEILKDEFTSELYKALEGEAVMSLQNKISESNGAVVTKKSAKKRKISVNNINFNPTSLASRTQSDIDVKSISKKKKTITTSRCSSSSESDVSDKGPDPKKPVLLSTVTTVDRQIESPVNGMNGVGFASKTQSDTDVKSISKKKTITQSSCSSSSESDDSDSGKKPLLLPTIERKIKTPINNMNGGGFASTTQSDMNSTSKKKSAWGSSSSSESDDCKEQPRKLLLNGVATQIKTPLKKQNGVVSQDFKSASKKENTKRTLWNSSSESDDSDEQAGPKKILFNTAALQIKSALIKEPVIVSQDSKSTSEKEKSKSISRSSSSDSDDSDKPLSPKKPPDTLIDLKSTSEKEKSTKSTFGSSSSESDDFDEELGPTKPPDTLIDSKLTPEKEKSKPTSASSSSDSDDSDEGLGPKKLSDTLIDSKLTPEKEKSKPTSASSSSDSDDSDEELGPTKPPFSTVQQIKSPFMKQPGVISQDLKFTPMKEKTKSTVGNSSSGRDDSDEPMCPKKLPHTFIGLKSTSVKEKRKLAIRSNSSGSDDSDEQLHPKKRPFSTIAPQVKSRLKKKADVSQDLKSTSKKEKTKSTLGSSSESDDSDKPLSPKKLPFNTVAPQMKSPLINQNGVVFQDLKSTSKKEKTKSTLLSSSSESDDSDEQLGPKKLPFSTVAPQIKSRLKKKAGAVSQVLKPKLGPVKPTLQHSVPQKNVESSFSTKKSVMSYKSLAGQLEKSMQKTGGKYNFKPTQPSTSSSDDDTD